MIACYDYKLLQTVLPILQLLILKQQIKIHEVNRVMGDFFILSMQLHYYRLILILQPRKDTTHSDAWTRKNSTSSRDTPHHEWGTTKYQ
jgi:hypothetical protein